VARVGQRALDSIVAPARVFADHAQYEVDTFSRSGRTADLLAAIVAIPLCSHQFPVSAQNCIRSHDRAYLLDQIPSENLAFDRQTAPLVIIEQDAFLPSFSRSTRFSVRRYSMTSCSR